ncbi:MULTISPECIES: hypothetical protein [Vibrio]|uniref:hypothetical protein n=1 Tax=Vibrio TaxID=662 RepID=UPI001BD66A87|nr:MULTISPECIES: hypothetical protein [Vibrio]MBT0080279.1 hypothetical protein [Vibrio alginolyticus]MBT0103528.1 hypothetical protein [Vibrio alginolyticus]MDW1974252.1 hypothetical protein [Vibrio sp. Vb1980]
MLSLFIFQMYIISHILFDDRKNGFFLVAMVLFFGLLCLVFQIYEYQTFSTLLYKTDEQTYIDLASKDIDDLARSLWILINKYFFYIEPTSNYYIMKMVNIPILMIFSYYFYLFLDSKKHALLLIVFVPYLFVMSVSNLRDLLILFSIVSFFYFLKKRAYSISVVFFFLLLFLRPLMAILSISSLLLVLFFMSNLKFRNKFLYFIVSLLFFIFAYILIKDYIASYFNYYTYLYDNSGDVDARGVVASGFNIKDFSYALLTYIATPMPHSLIERIVDGGSEIWGITDDVFRAIGQVLYYIMIASIVFITAIKPKKSIEKIKLVPVELKALILTFILYAPIYAIHLSGITHQRLKVPFQIAVFIIFIILFFKVNHENEEKGIE